MQMLETKQQSAMLEAELTNLKKQNGNYKTQLEEHKASLEALTGGNKKKKKKGFF